MAEQMLAVCDDSGIFVDRYLGREDAHRIGAPRHLAVVVLLADEAGRVLLQRRKHPLFDDLLDLTAATHLLKNGPDSHESFEQAGARALESEYGLNGVDLNVVAAFNYLALDGDSCEHEHCAVLLGNYGGHVSANPAVAYGTEWWAWPDLVRDIAANPSRFTPWAREAADLLSRARHFGAK